MNWRDTLIGPNHSIQAAIGIIDRGAKRVALVVDDDGRLLGTVTDGDVRRGILRHLPLDSPVEQVMNRAPKTLPLGYGREDALRLCGDQQILQIPIVDQDRRVVGLETLSNLLRKPRYDNPVFLMAGGFGTRLKPLTDRCPKPMLPVGDRPILQNILENLIGYGFHRFLISVHYLAEQVIDHFGDGSKWGIRIEYVHESQPLGTAGALGLLPRDLPDLPVLVVNGDILVKLNYEALLAYHQSHAPAATVCVREYSMQVPYGVVEADQHRLTDIVEKPVQQFFINAGIYLLSPAVVKSVEPNRRVDMPELLKGLLRAGRPVSIFPVYEYWLDIGQMNDFQLAQQIMERG
jgi:dTDP-glucose pyrophosphorylase